ncbi:MAG: hypothetical protein KDA69_19825 [Planctomycetaceae bacterium]|nr:hypothetical protein [Planctomycetaceae bacterium]
MCVDFAWKEWEQGEKKWAIRNVKLRMSRKLIFVAGLLATLASDWLFPTEVGAHLGKMQGAYDREMSKFRTLLFSFLSPAEIVATACINAQLDDLAVDLFTHYDQFLEMIGTVSTRKHLEELKQEDHAEDDTFQEFRQNSHRFQGVLESMFFDPVSPFSARTRKYGLF